MARLVRFVVSGIARVWGIVSRDSGIIFYGNGAVDRHMKAAHPNEWEEYEAGGGMHQEEGATAAEFLHQPIAPRHRMPPGGSAHHGQSGRRL